MSSNAVDQLWAIDTEIEDFLLDRQVQRVSPGTLRWHKHCLGKWRTYCVEHKVCATAQTTPHLLRAFVAQLEADGHNEGGIATIYRSVKALLLWYEKEYEPTNWRSPTHKIKFRAPKTPLLEPVSLEHFRAMVATCKAGTFTGIRDLAILCVLLDSGVRRQELIDLTVGDVNLSTGEILIRRGKGGKTRIVFVGATARQALEEYMQFRNGLLTHSLRQRNNFLESEALWLTDQASPLTIAGMRQVIRRRTIHAGVPQYSPHAFRRAFAINSLRNGMDVITLQRLMGHSSLEVTTRYLKFVTEDLAMAHAKFGVVDHLTYETSRLEAAASLTEHETIARNLSGSIDQVSEASKVENDSRLQHSAPKNKADARTERKKPSRKPKMKRPTIIKYTYVENEGKRPARLNY